MTLTGKVCAVDGDRVIVEVRSVDGCKGCKACGGLVPAMHGQDSADTPHGSARSDPLGEEAPTPVASRRVEALREGFDLSPGDQVTLGTRPGEMSVAALLIFGLPLVGFFAGMWAGPLVLGSPEVLATDGQHIIGGGVGAAAAIGLLFLLSWSGHLRRLGLKVTGKIDAACAPARTAEAATAFVQ